MPCHKQTTLLDGRKQSSRVIWVKLSFILLNFTDNDSNTNIHGPYAGGDKFLYLLGRLGPSEEYTHDIGRVASPMYTQSSAECRLDVYFFINGTTGQTEGTNDPAALGNYDFTF